MKERNFNGSKALELSQFDTTVLSQCNSRFLCSWHGTQCPSLPLWKSVSIEDRPKHKILRFDQASMMRLVIDLI